MSEQPPQKTPLATAPRLKTGEQQQHRDPQLVFPLPAMLQGQVQVVSATTSSFAGPLPAPEILGGYEEVLPGLADRVVRMAEKEQHFRHESGREVGRSIEMAARSNESARTRGQWFGLVVALAGISGAVALGVADKQTAASVLGGTTLLSLVSTFIVGQQSRQRQAATKAQSAPSAKTPSQD
jgi:uncharacterized membrane protein